MNIKSESNLWAYIREGMLGGWHATRHEDRLTGGTPDISYGINGHNGWIELKWLDKSPRTLFDPVKIDHFTGDQKRFLRDRGGVGGHCWLLIGVGGLGWDINRSPAFILVNSDQIDDSIGDTATMADLFSTSTRVWRGKIPFEQLAEILEMKDEEGWASDDSYEV